MTPTPYSDTELLALTLRGGTLDPMRVLATYADPSAWEEVKREGHENYKKVGGGDETPSEWVFSGGLKPGYALAQNALAEAPTPT
jgi:hypothetical protein